MIMNSYSTTQTGSRKTKFSRLLPVCAILSAAVFCPASYAMDLTVEDAVSAALRSNVGLYNAQKARDAMSEKVREYWGSVYPSIGLSASYTRNIALQSIYFNGSMIPMGADNAYALGANLTQVIWAGGKVKTGINMAELYSANAEQQVRQTEIQLAKTVRTLCYDIILSSATAEIEEENLSITQKHLDQIRARYKQGLSSDIEELRQKVEVSNALPAVTKAQNLLETGLLSLKQTLAEDPEIPLALDYAETPFDSQSGDINELYKVATAKRPELIMARLQYQLAGEQIQLAHGDVPVARGQAEQRKAGRLRNVADRGRCPLVDIGEHAIRPTSIVIVVGRLGQTVRV